MPMAWTEHEKAASKKPALRFVANRHIFLPAFGDSGGKMVRDVVDPGL
jgi:hypothetical protein